MASPITRCRRPFGESFRSDWAEELLERGEQPRPLANAEFVTVAIDVNAA
jgi:hypothetical protein